MSHSLLISGLEPGFDGVELVGVDRSALGLVDRVLDGLGEQLQIPTLIEDERRLPEEGRALLDPALLPYDPVVPERPVLERADAGLLEESLLVGDPNLELGEGVQLQSFPSFATSSPNSESISRIAL